VINETEYGMEKLPSQIERVFVAAISFLLACCASGSGGQACFGWKRRKFVKLTNGLWWAGNNEKMAK